MSRQSDLDNHANQLNPEHQAYWDSRGLGNGDDDYDDCVDDYVEGWLDDNFFSI